jgi:hypothetical protein
MVEPLPVKFKFSSRKFFPKLQPISRIKSGKMSLSIDLYLIVSANSDHLLKLCCFWYWKKNVFPNTPAVALQLRYGQNTSRGESRKGNGRPFHISGSTIIYGSAKTGIGKPTQHSREENRGYGKLTKKIN